MNAVDLLKKQHKEVKSLFKKMDKTEAGRERRQLPQVDVEDEQFEAKMTVLSEFVEHHADEEEMFKTANKIGEDELEDLGARMEARFEEVTGEGRRRAA